MIKKKYPANTPEIEKLFRQAKSRLFTKKSPCIKFDHVVEFFQNTYTSLNVSNPPPPNTPFCEFIGLFSSRNLQVTISRVNISVFKGRPKRKIRPT